MATLIEDQYIADLAADRPTVVDVAELDPELILQVFKRVAPTIDPVSLENLITRLLLVAGGEDWNEVSDFLALTYVQLQIDVLHNFSEVIDFIRQWLPKVSAENAEILGGDIGIALLLSGRKEEAVEVLVEAAVSASTPAQRSKVLGDLGAAYAQLGLLSEAESVLTEALTIARSLPGFPDGAKLSEDLAMVRMGRSM